MEDLKKIEDNVKLLLIKFPQLRRPWVKRQIHWAYWREFQGVNSIIEEELYCKNLVDPETISRAIRKIKKKYPELRPPIHEDITRYRLSNRHYQHHLRKKLDF